MFSWETKYSTKMDSENANNMEQKEIKGDNNFVNKIVYPDDFKIKAKQKLF